MIKFQSRNENRIRRTNSRNQRAADERADAKKDRDAKTERLRALRLANAAEGGDAKKNPETKNQGNGKTSPVETAEEKSVILPVPHRR